MSLSNILHPNNYELYCKTIHIIEPGGGNLVTATGLYSLLAADQSIPNNVETNIVYDGQTVIGTLPVTYNSTNGVFTVIKDCTISATMQNVFTPGGSGSNHFRVCLRKGSVNYGIFDLFCVASTGAISSSYNASLTGGDTFSIVAYQNTGSANALKSVSTNSANHTFFSAVFTYVNS
jgi:hypothetical protein